jgi:hypothetical protein
MYQNILAKSTTFVTDWPLTGASLVKYKHLYTWEVFIYAVEVLDIFVIALKLMVEESIKH